MSNQPFRIAIWGSPGAGKSRTAARLFADLKDLGVSPLELVKEAAKEWAWANRTIAPWDQWVLFGEQLRREYELLRNGVSLITDCPLDLNYIYSKELDTPCYSLIPIISSQLDFNFPYRYDFFINRPKTYDPKGRFQTEEEAKVLDKKILAYLEQNHPYYIHVDSYDELLKKVKECIIGDKPDEDELCGLCNRRNCQNCPCR